MTILRGMDPVAPPPPPPPPEPVVDVAADVLAAALVRFLPTTACPKYLKEAAGPWLAQKGTA